MKFIIDVEVLRREFPTECFFDKRGLPALASFGQPVLITEMGGKERAAIIMRWKDDVEWRVAHFGYSSNIGWEYLGEAVES